jgi:hypothetical protein
MQDLTPRSPLDRPSRDNRCICGALEEQGHEFPSRGYVVARAARGPGIGTRLLSLAGAVWLARRLGRAVVIDWRESAYLEDPSLDYFTELFEPVPEMLGVPFVPLADVPDHRDVSEDEKVKLHASELRKMLADGRPAPRFLITAGVVTLADLDPSGDAHEHHRFLKAFYGYLTPRADIAEALDAWHDEHFRDRFVIGVNVSSGNGSFGPDRKKNLGRVDTRIFEDERRFLDKLERACDLASDGLPPSDRDRRRVFFATDSTSMAELLGRLPGAITRRSVFPPPGVGRRFSAYGQLGYSDRAAAADTVIDMFLLARCQALIRNESKFSTFALVSTDYFDGNVYDFEGNRQEFDALRLSVRGKGITDPAAAEEKRRRTRARRATR